MIFGGSKIMTFVIMLIVSSEIFRKSWEFLMKDANKGLSFSDKSRDIDNIMSFYSDFDGLVPKIS